MKTWALFVALALPAATAENIGQRIYQNECSGKIQFLTHWNKGEDFASLGIGHFIWYPAGPKGPFSESFPLLLDFLAAHAAVLPQWLKDRPVCPWNTREEFFAEIDSPRMAQLRQLLKSTIDIQARFLVQRLEEALPKMLDSLPASQRPAVRAQFYRVARSSGGYALVDYVNFKGEGTSKTERYKGQGWGLLQVLQEMKGTKDGQAARDEFSASAGRILARRVKNSPSQRNEARWLPNWRQRVETYRLP